MTFSMPFTENETKHLIYLLNCEYRKKREIRERMLSNFYLILKSTSFKQELDDLS